MAKTISISIGKADVLDEVAKTSAYIGSKKVEQKEGAYDRIFVTTEDRQMLDRFYSEGRNALTNLLRRFIVGASNDSSDDYKLELSMSSRFDEAITESMKGSMTAFLVNYIIGKWCEIANRDDTKVYADTATAMLEEVKEKAFYKTKPSRKSPI